MERRIGRNLAGLLDAMERSLSPWVRHTATECGLLLVFALSTAERLMGAAARGTFGVDLRIYRAAAEAAIAGRDPWSASVGGLTFAGPPPALLPYLPAALLPEGVAIVLYGALTLLGAVAALRAARVPVWWLLFPPISDSLIVLSSDVVVIALLLAVPRLAAVSVVLKVYAAIPLAIGARWRPLAIGLGLCLLSAPWWSAFLAARESVSVSLQTQSFGGLSAWGSWLIVPAVLALIALWRRGAEWLAIPAVWPYTQLHYNVLALPIAAKSPIVAFLMSFAVWPLPAVAAIVYALQLFLLRLAAPYRVGAVKTAPSSSSR
jgi:hypothetical protein